MWIVLRDYRFFFEVRPIEELQGSDGSPRREEVGRRTLGDYGGFLLSFFYPIRGGIGGEDDPPAGPLESVFSPQQGLVARLLD